MYEWSSQQRDLLLITGHTHQPVFESLTHLERLQREEARKLTTSGPDRSSKNPSAIDFSKVKPTYFNTGCCCYNDGDITGIEIADGCIRLVKWEDQDEKSVRVELEKISFEQLTTQLSQ